MLAGTNGGLKRASAWGAVLALGAWVAACASAPTPEPAATAPTAAATDAVTDVWIEQDGDVSLVTLVGLDDPVYTAFLREEPAALVVDVAETSAEVSSDPLVVYDGLIEQVSVASYEEGPGASTRIEVGLSEAASYSIIPTSVGLAIRLERDQTVGAQDAEDLEESAESDPWSEGSVQPVASPDPLEDATLAPATAPEAKSLASVQVTPAEGGVLIHLVADGMIEGAESFTLENPSRLVVDLPGLASNVSQPRTDVGLAQVKRVRVGAHPDKVRVVIDGGSSAGDFSGRRIVPAANGLFVALGSGPSLDQALSTAMNASLPAEAADESLAILVEDEPIELESAVEEPVDDDVSATTEEPLDDALATVHGIHYDSQPQRDRIVVLSEGPLEYEKLTPDAETVVISLKDARIPREAEGRITPQVGGPVSLITAFQQPDVETPEVRIVVKRAADLEPEISRRGEILFIDFPNTGTAAAPPPAFPGAAIVQTTEVGESASAQVSPSGETAADAAARESAQLAAFEEGGEPLVQTSEISELPQFSQPAALDSSAPMPSSSASAAQMAGAGPAALEPPAAVDLLQEGGLIDGKEYQGRRISLDFKEVEIADVLRIIAEVSDLNIVAGEEVDGSVTIRLVDVPWDQALDVILLTKGLGFVRVGNVLRIAPADILAQEEEVRLQERRNKEKLEDLVVKLHPVNYANVKDVQTLVKRLLSARGTVNIDERTNTLIMKDIPAVIDEATALVNAVDTQTPQVMIEAKIVEAALDFSRELGTIWQIGTQPFEDGFQGDDPRRDLGAEDFRFHDENSLTFFNPITSVPTGLATLNAFILDEKIDLNVSIQAAESTGDGKVISSPRVVTLDNREAEIKQGVSIPFQTFENGDAKLEFVEAVLRLLVTPHITADKSIIMKLEVQRNAPDDSVATPTGSPAIAKNEARTETLVKDGQTLVIGGIYTIVKSERQSRVPYLHQIPVLGALFKNKEVTDQRKELLIFVTPRIVQQPAAA